MRFIRFINNFQISLEEKRSLQDKLVSSSYAVSGITVEDQDFYKVSDSLRVSDAYSPHVWYYSVVSVSHGSCRSVFILIVRTLGK